MNGAYLLGIMLFMSLCSFTLMGVDKWKAKRGAWRIPEVTLFAFAAILGAPGGYLGMLVFRHKTRHTKFSVGFPLLMTIQLIFVGWPLFG